jgi:hypothetical protein
MLLAALALAVSSPPAGAQSFTKVLDAGNPIPALGSGPGGSFIGSSWVDTDGDGDLDLFIVRQGLFRNDGGGTFTHLPLAIRSQGSATGVTWGDVDNDGDPDCYIAGGIPSGSALYLNAGGNAFNKVVTGAIKDTLIHLGWAAAFADYDRDGWLDLVLAAPFGFNGVNGPNRLFHNEGGGIFTRVDSSTVATGTAPYTVPSWCDFDVDGDPDLFIGSGSGGGPLLADYLYRNRHETKPGWLQRYTAAPLATDLQDGQLYHWIDYDNDGDLDTYLTNFGGNANRLYRNDGGGVFTGMTGAQAGPIVTDIAPSLASVWEDFDNDGDPDCYVTNAQTFAGKFYLNDGAGMFTSLTVPDLTTNGPRWGATAGDYDQDGDMDLYVNGVVSTHGLFRNTNANGNAWVIVNPEGAISNRSAIGVVIRVRATIGGQPRWQMRLVSAQNSFDGMSSLERHFGLGDATVIDSLIVEWPSGERTLLTGQPVNARMKVVEPSGPTAVQVSLAEQIVEPKRVRIVWAVHSAGAEVIAVERRPEGGEWTVIARPAVDGLGRVTIDDRDVKAGTRLAYRLVTKDADGVQYVGLVEVAVPLELGFSIRPFGANPARGQVRVLLDLPDDPAARPVHVEMMDTAGRRVAAERFAGGAAVSRVLRLGPSDPAPGVYLVRVTQGDRSAQTKLAVIE